MMKKYYIEFWSKRNYASSGENYLLQTKWFDTKEEAIKWYKDNIAFISDDLNADLMVSTLDIEADTYEDIEFLMRLSQ